MKDVNTKFNPKIEYIHFWDFAHQVTTHNFLRSTVASVLSISTTTSEISRPGHPGCHRTPNQLDSRRTDGHAQYNSDMDLIVLANRTSCFTYDPGELCVNVRFTAD